MSASRKSRRLKTFNPEEQPQIHQFIVNSGQSQTAHTITPPNTVNSATPPSTTPNETKGKKCRRSTGEKIVSPKKRKPCCRSNSGSQHDGRREDRPKQCHHRHVT